MRSTMHPIMGPDRDSGMPSEVFNRQSSTTDLGAMAQRVNAKHLVLTHLGPSIGAAFQGAYKVPGGALTAADLGRLPRRADLPATSSWAPIWRAANSREVSRASYGTLPSASGALATIGFRRWSLEC